MGLGSLWKKTGGKVVNAVLGEGGLTDSIAGIQVTGDGGLLDTATHGAQVKPEDIKEMGKTFGEMAYDPNEANFGIDNINHQQAANNTSAAAAANHQAPEAEAATMDAAQGTNATLNTTQSDQARAQQIDLINQLTHPTGPSAAQLQQQRGVDAAIAAQRANAASSRGMGVGMANKIAQGNIADITSKGAADAAMLQAQETQQRQAMAGQMLQGVRSEDVETARANASMQQQTLMQNAGMSQEAAAKNAEMAQQVALANQQAGMTQEQINNSMIQFYKGLNLSLDQAQLAASMALEQLKAGQSAAVMNATAGIVSQNAAAQAQATAALIGGIGTAYAASDEDLKTGVTDGSDDLDDFLDSVTTSLPKPSISDNAVEPSVHAGENKAKAAGLEAPSIGEAKTGPGKHVDVPDTEMAPWQKALLAGSQAYAKAMATNKFKNPFLQEMSDEDQKENAEPASMDAFLDALAAYKYQYKEPEKFGKGTHFSVMAQDLEKTPVGKSMVVDTPEGKMVDYGRGFAVLLAAMADSHRKQGDIDERLAELEGKKRKTS